MILHNLPANLLGYDIEVYPNFFCATFKDVRTGKVYVYRRNSDVNQLSAMLKLLRQEGLCLIGHNTLAYDNIVVRWIIQNPRAKAEDIYHFSKRVFTKDETIPLELKYPRTKLWEDIDTLAITRVNAQRVGLKTAGVVTKFHTIKDLPYPPDEPLTVEQMEEVVRYNLNDVELTIHLFHVLKNEVDVRISFGDMYDLSLLSANDTEIGKHYLTKIYTQKSGIPYQELKELRTIRHQVNVAECLPANYHFVTEQLQELERYLSSLTLYEYNRYKYSKIITINNTTYSLGIGGIHSEDKLRPGVFRTDDDFEIVDADVTSFYPMIILNNRIVPKHLDANIFLEVLQGIVTERIEAKASNNTIVSLILKIAINSLFGQLKNEFYWLYDPKALISVTIGGQLLILDLIEKLELSGIEVISANTDGVTCKIPRHLKNTYYDVCKDWENRTKYALEYVTYTMYARRDVNNYVAVTEKGKVKTKGFFRQPKIEFDKENLIKGFHRVVIGLAVCDYFVHGTPVDKFIRNHKDPHDFVVFKRIDPEKFDLVYSYIASDGLCEEIMQKTTRAIVTRNGIGSLYKRSVGTGRKDALIAGHTVIPTNTEQELQEAFRNVDYDYYIKAALSEIAGIEVSQDNCALF